MESSHPTSITPEQLAAINLGGGCANLHDPDSERRFLLVEQIQPNLSDTYFQEKVEEGLRAAEQGEVAEWDVEAVRAELHRRLAENKKQD